MKQRIVRHSGLLAIVWALLIFLLCATPGRFIPAAGWLQLLSFDKLVHAAIFFVLASLIILALYGRGALSAVRWWLPAAVLYGIILEVLQATVFVDRSFELFDALANAVGVVLAAILQSRILNWTTARDRA